MTGDVRGRDVVVLGLGETGLSLARWLTRHGARVRVADTRQAPPGATRSTRRCRGVRLESGPFVASTFDGADMIAISPGVRQDQPAIAEAVRGRRDARRRRRALRAARCRAGPKVIAITGTNGKTTVTALAGALAARRGSRRRWPATSARRCSTCWRRTKAARRGRTCSCSSCRVSSSRPRRRSDVARRRC